jgi:hypothetical protein
MATKKATAKRGKKLSAPKKIKEQKPLIKLSHFPPDPC